MKRVLFVLFGVMAALTAVSLIVAFTRPIKWPANVRPLEWRRAIGDGVDRKVEEVAA